MQKEIKQIKNKGISRLWMYLNSFSQEKAERHGHNLAVACTTLTTLINTCTHSPRFQWKFYVVSVNFETLRWGIHWGLPATRKQQLAQLACLSDPASAQECNITGPGFGYSPVVWIPLKSTVWIWTSSGQAGPSLWISHILQKFLRNRN